MNKGYLTTFEAAKLISVTPDSILKWIKSGKLAAFRTPGGHYRINIDNIKGILLDSETSSQFSPTHIKRSDQFCWEFNSQLNDCTNQCEECLVYKAQAKRCYEMSDFSIEMGYLRRFCKSSCQECEYFNLLKSDN